VSRVEKVSASGGEEESRVAQLCAISDDYEEDVDIVVVLKREGGARGSDKRWVYAGDGRATI